VTLFLESKRAIPHILLPNEHYDTQGITLVFDGISLREFDWEAAFQKVIRLKQNEKVRIFGITDSKEKSIQEAVKQGKLIEKPQEPYTAYFFEFSLSENLEDIEGIPTTTPHP
jgi:hypothetical protein